MTITIRPAGPAIDAGLLKRAKRASVPTFGHYIEDGAMDPGIVAQVFPARFAGRAVTVRTTAPDSALVHKAVGLLEEGDVLVVDLGADRLHAPVGAVVALAASLRGAAAIVIDGPCTDVVQLREIGLPIFSRGLSCLTTKLHGLDTGSINGAVSCGGVAVRPGDLVMGDENGVLVIPPAVAAALIDTVLDDDATEPALCAHLREGARLPDATGITAMLQERYGL